MKYVISSEKKVCYKRKLFSKLKYLTTNRGGQGQGLQGGAQGTRGISILAGGTGKEYGI